MKIQTLASLAFANAIVILGGCATDPGAASHQQKQKIEWGEYLLSASGAKPGQTYEVKVYVIKSGDTISLIAQKFHISVSDLRALNPQMNAFRLVVGQKIRVSQTLEN